jgi:hypothetical protein
MADYVEVSIGKVTQQRGPAPTIEGKRPWVPSVGPYTISDDRQASTPADDLTTPGDAAIPISRLRSRGRPSKQNNTRNIQQIQRRYVERRDVDHYNALAGPLVVRRE